MRVSIPYLVSFLAGTTRDEAILSVDKVDCGKQCVSGKWLRPLPMPQPNKIYSKRSPVRPTASVIRPWFVPSIEAICCSLNPSCRKKAAVFCSSSLSEPRVISILFSSTPVLGCLNVAIGYLRLAMWTARFRVQRAAKLAGNTTANRFPAPHNTTLCRRTNGDRLVLGCAIGGAI